MFALPGTVFLIAFIYVRPQEFIEPMQKLPLLYLFCGMSLFGFLIDLKLRTLKPIPTPQFRWVLLFVLWVVISDAVFVPGPQMMPNLIEIGVVFLLWLVIAHGVQSFHALRVVCGSMIIIGLFLTFVGIHQDTAPYGCVVADEEHPGEGNADGRYCNAAIDCLAGGEPGNEYTCEKVGLFGTTSITGRVRYRGELQDPNELALAICATLPFLFAFAARKRKRRWKLWALLGTLAILWCVVATQSRGGQLVFLAVLGVFFIQRIGWKGIVLGAVLALPVLMLGGRSDSRADASTMQRYEAWSAGSDMFRSNPIFGVGHRQFTEHHYLTAHNSYVLTPAELGIIGMVLWGCIVYMTIKIPLTGALRYRGVPGADAAHTWGLAILAAMAGFLIQMTFLSLSYHSMLWIYFGISGAYYSAVKAHDPDFKVSFGFKDLALVTGLALLYIGIVVPIFVRLKGF